MGRTPRIRALGTRHSLSRVAQSQYDLVTLNRMPPELDGYAWIRHGSTHRVLAASVRSIEMVTASGDLVELSREGDPEVFDGAVLALGSLGGAHVHDP